ncbi:PEP-CTERM sorting domain-containing protein [Cerasicoccus fimbriatus]|uniref:PEP-CTERM sorting domain-containing protein n=1 Tax=Cerasicoccus fimbriatus TaxID=3014554 RepID=UPI0022B52718|nr:PEP-CTERM sorting domain-containing protein [Cerasicoccus sp. TK19100]
MISLKQTLCISAFGALAATASHGLVIIDGTAPDYLNNGSFETLTNWWIDSSPTPLSADLNLDQGFLQRNTITPADGSWYSVVGANSGATELRGFYIDTGYDLSEGDTFDLSFFVGNHQSVESSDTIAWRLLTTTTDTDQGTVETIVASGTVLATTSTTMEERSLTGVGSVTSGMSGERLFLAFSPGNLNGDYVALDEVNLTLVPEPQTYALMMGAVALGGLLWRRRQA